MFQQDSASYRQTQYALPVIDDVIIDNTEEEARPLTPYQVLRMLPRDATPAQQDSAIQAWFKPGEIHYSQQPDTLHLPGHEPARDLKDVNLPQYYRENYFSNDSLLHPEISGGRFGVAGDPLPYTIRGDNMLTSMLLLCFVVFVVSISRVRQYIDKQFKHFFYESPNNELVSETSGEVRFQFFLVLLACLMLGIAIYQYVTHYVANTFIVDENYLLVVLFGVGALVYYVTKGLLYSGTNSIFFDGKKTLQWMKTILFITAVEGVLLYPAVVLQVYFDISLQNITYYYVFVLILTKTLTFYKGWVIFFRTNGGFLQNILYFCALEITPLLVLAGALLWIVNLLKINF